MERNRWNTERMKKAMEEGKEEFIELSIKLHNLLVDFGVRALKTFQAGRGEPLNRLQVNQVVVREVEQVVKQISDPEFIELVVKKAEMKYYETSEE